MINYIRVISIATICLFSLNFNTFAEENITDEAKIDNGTYVYDPFENVNRSILKFNVIVDDIAIQPIVSTYKTVTPDIAEKGIFNFFSNLKEPLNSVAFLLQGDPGKSLNSIGRFLTNSITTLGFYDTSKHLGLKKNNSDMGVVIGKSGIPSGPFLIIPILGPANTRDLAGRVLDTYVNPINIAYSEIRLSKGIGSGIVARSEYDREYNDLKTNSNDLYDSIKLLYHQRRMGEINKDHLRDLPVPKIYIE
tara:strand:- start:648 stop:1397 length:750 start_codon:yes stop_codon:yes gene_type:complete